MTNKDKATIPYHLKRTVDEYTEDELQDLIDQDLTYRDYAKQEGAELSPEDALDKVSQLEAQVDDLEQEVYSYEEQISSLDSDKEHLREGFDAVDSEIDNREYDLDNAQDMFQQAVEGLNMWLTTLPEDQQDKVLGYVGDLETAMESYRDTTIEIYRTIRRICEDRR